MALARPDSLTLHFADVAKRFFAAVIDGVILGMFNGVLYVILQAGRDDLRVSERAVDVAALAFALLSSWLYAALLEGGRGRATFGKVALGIQVTDRQGRRVSFLRATARHFAKLLAALPCFVGLAVAAVDRQRRGAHDFLAGTLVLEVR